MADNFIEYYSILIFNKSISFDSLGKEDDYLVLVGCLINLQSILSIIKFHFKSLTSKTVSKAEIKKLLSYRSTFVVISHIINYFLETSNIDYNSIMRLNLHEKIFLTRNQSSQKDININDKTNSFTELKEIVMDTCDLHKENLLQYFSHEGKSGPNNLNLNIIFYLKKIKADASQYIYDISSELYADDSNTKIDAKWHSEIIQLILKLQYQLPSGESTLAVIGQALYSFLATADNSDKMYIFDNSDVLSHQYIYSSFQLNNETFHNVSDFSLTLIDSAKPALQLYGICILFYSLALTTSSDIMDHASFLISQLLSRISMLDTPIHTLIISKCFISLFISSVPHIDKDLNYHGKNKLTIGNFLKNSSLQYSHNFFQIIYVRINLTQNVENIFYLTKSLNLFLPFCPIEVVLCQYSYISEMLVAIASKTSPQIMGDNSIVFYLFVVILEIWSFLIENIPMFLLFSSKVKYELLKIKFQFERKIQIFEQLSSNNSNILNFCRNILESCNSQLIKLGKN